MSVTKTQGIHWEHSHFSVVGTWKGIVPPPPLFLLCGLTASCTYVVMILILLQQSNSNYWSKKGIFCSPLWPGPRCSQNWMRSYRNLDIGTKAGPKYSRILSLSIQLSSLYIFACWPESPLLQVRERVSWSALPGFHTHHQGHAEWEKDCSPDEIWVPSRPTPDIHYKCCLSKCCPYNMPGTVLRVLHIWSHLVPKLTLWGRSSIR